MAEVLVVMGHTVTGTDQRESSVLDRLRAAGVGARAGHDPAAVGDAEVVAVSSAIGGRNPEVLAARAAGIPVLSRADLLAAICGLRRTVAVAGTHGKTTTSAMLATVLAEAGLRPSWLVGGELGATGSGARWDDGEWLVVEADESDGTFLRLPVDVAVVTSVEPDHLEHWGGFDELRAAFGRFAAGARTAAVVSADDPAAGALGSVTGALTVTFGQAPEADFRIVDLVVERGGCRFGLARGGEVVGPVWVPVPGAHNAANAAAALAVAATVGVVLADGAESLASFAGVRRRFERRGERDGVTFVDDYAHLPGEVAAMVGAARSGGWARIVCVFQPHRFSRTATVGKDFGGAFAGADVVAVTDLYAAGEERREGVTGKVVLDAVAAGPSCPPRLLWLPDRADLLRWLRRELRPGDLCLTLGAGDLTTLPAELGAR